MKRTLLSSLLLAAGLTAFAQAERTVTLDEAGTLKMELGSDYLNVTKLTVNGPINSADIITLRAMMGVDKSENTTSEGALEDLDLKGATFVGGGEAFMINSAGGKYLNDNKAGVAMFRNGRIKHLVLPDNCVAIEKYAFANCAKLEKVEFTDNVAQIDEFAFNNCIKLTDVTHSKNLVSYSTGIFRNTGFTHVVIPDWVTYIGWYCFESCQNLETVSFGAETMTVSATAFKDVLYVEDVYVHNDQAVMGGDYRTEGAGVAMFDTYNAEGKLQPCLDDSDYESITLHVPSKIKSEYEKDSFWNRMTIETLDNDPYVGISATTTLKGEDARYSISGTRLSAPTQGLNIVRMADGSVKKVLVK